MAGNKSLSQASLIKEQGVFCLYSHQYPAVCMGTASRVRPSMAGTEGSVSNTLVAFRANPRSSHRALILRIHLLEWHRTRLHLPSHVSARGVFQPLCSPISFLAHSSRCNNGKSAQRASQSHSQSHSRSHCARRGPSGRSCKADWNNRVRDCEASARPAFRLVAMAIEPPIRYSGQQPVESSGIFEVLQHGYYTDSRPLGWRLGVY